MALATTLFGASFAGAASAATTLPAPTNLHVSTPAPSNTTIDIGWNAVSGATSYQVSRSGTPTYTSAHVGTHFQFTALTPGTSYTLTVATNNAVGTGPSVSITVKTTGTSGGGGGTGTLVVSNVSMSADNAGNPLFSSPANSVNGVNAGGPANCNGYHFSDQQCGQVNVSLTITGYTGPTDGMYWYIAGDISRTFGCYNTTKGTFTSTTTITSHRVFDQYASYFSSPATNTNIYGTYDFTTPNSWTSGDDMPAPFACPWGTYDKVDYTTVLTNVTATLYNTGGIGGDGTTTGLPLPLASVTVPGSASATFSDNTNL